MVNLGTVFNRGAAIESTYMERFVLSMVDDLGYHLAGRHYWYNPTKLASPMPWVAIRRKRVKPSVETIYRSEEHTSELQSLMRISYAVFCLKKKKQST